MRVFISAPYSEGDTIFHVRKVIDVADELVLRGHLPFIPHLYHFWHFVHPHSKEYWLLLNKRWLAQCDVLLRLLGESEGCVEEMSEAERLGIPVVYSIHELEEFIRWKGGEKE